MSEDEKTDFLVLPLDVGSRVFDSIDELQEWVQKERSAIAWLQSAGRNDNSLQQVWSHFNQWLQAVDQAIKNYNQQKDNEQQKENTLRQLKNQFSQFLQRGSIKTSSSPEVVFVNQLRESGTDVEAAYALAYLLNTSFNMSSPVAMSGAFKAFLYHKGDTSTVEAQQAALESTKRSWARRFGHQLAKLKSENERLSESKQSLMQDIEDLKSTLNELKKTKEKEFNTLIDDSKTTLADVEHTYDEKLSLQSSVSYWSNKRRAHTIVMAVMGLVTLGIAGVTGGGFLYVAHKFLQVAITEVQAWQVGLVLAISTFGIWLTRLSTKIFISNLHLRTDADERVTMIQTYLAMLREGQGLEENDRQLILQTLFRPSATGYISEELPSSPYDLLGSILKRSSK